MRFKQSTLYLIAFSLFISLINLTSSALLPINYENVASQSISITPLDYKTIVYASTGGGNVSFRIYDVNGTALTNKILINSSIGTEARVYVDAVNSTTFSIGWYNDVNKSIWYQFFNRQGINQSNQRFVEAVGTATTNYIDFSVRLQGDSLYMGYVNDIDNGAYLDRIYLNGSYIETTIQADVRPERPLQNLISCRGYLADYFVCFYYDDLNDDADFVFINKTNMSVVSSTAIDVGVGNEGNVALEVADNLIGLLWGANSKNLYFQIRNSSNSIVVPTIVVDSDIGTPVNSRISLASAYSEQFNRSTFIVSYNDGTANQLLTSVYLTNGTLIHSYTIDTAPSTTNRLFDSYGYSYYDGFGQCNNTFSIAYLNSTNSQLIRTLYINGTAWDGYCLSAIDSIKPNGTLLQPVNNLYTNITLVNFTINATDNIGLSNITLYIYNGTALVSTQTQSVSGTGGLFGIIYDFLFNDIFTWFYQVIDTAGNIFTTENRTIIVDTIYPQLAITYPLDLTYYPYVVSNITHVVNETNLANCTFNNGTYNVLITCNAPYYQNAVEGSNLWYITATDMVGQSYVKPVSFVVDTIYPQINFSGGTPANNSLTNSKNIFVNVTINETNFKSIRFILANATQIINDVSFLTPITSAVFLNNSDGTYFFNVTIEDLAGNINSTETRQLTIDTIPPSIIVNSPQPINYTNDSILVNITSDGFEIFYLNGLGLEEYVSPVYKTYPQGYFNFSAIAEDEAGNQNITNFIFFVDSLPPSLTYIAPTEANNSVKGINTIRVRTSVVEASLENITTKLFNSTHNEIASATSNSSPFLVEFVNLSNGVYYFNSTACDVFSTCESAETRRVTINQGLLGTLTMSLLISQYPYVDVNVSYPIKVDLKVGNLSVSDAITNMTITLLNGTNISFILPYNSTSGYYEVGLLFDEIGNFPFTIKANSTSFGFVQESGTFIARSPFYLTIRLFDRDSLDNIENDFAYVTAEYTGGRKIDEFVEPFIYPVVDNRFVAEAFHSPYINGEANLKLYEPQRDYVFRYFDGVVNFDGVYSAPNVTKSYGTNVYLGTQYINGTDGVYQFVLTKKDQNPYRWLFNWVLIIGLVLIMLVAGILFFMFPQYPWIALIFGLLFPLILLAIRLVVWWFWKW